MISRIVEPHLHIGVNAVDEFNDNILGMNEETERYLAETDDELKKIFEVYCSFGEPTNTTKLKSSKLLKLLKDCNIIKGHRKRHTLNGGKQIESTDMDLIFI